VADVGEETYPVLDPQDLYELADDLPEMGRSVLVQAMSGFVDAGNAVRLTREHLLETLDARVVATFDIDRLLDYRSRRPVMIFNEDHWEHYDEPLLAVHLLHDDAATPFLLLSGPEPDLYWERFAVAVRTLVQQLNVRLTVGLNAIPMAVPHTRQSGVTAHATRRDLITGYEPWIERVQVPGSAGSLLEYRLGRWGFDAMGFAVHVPHYLVQTDYPAAAEQLLASVSRATGLLLPADRLHTAAETVHHSIDKEIARSEEARALVQALEQQYDASRTDRRGANPLITPSGTLPTADELGAELERFLSQQNKPGDPPGA
jgi:predicted ATP-grasp superfamily ATP-dependent carboligase